MEEVKEGKKGWNWLGFLFAPLYYSGYGDMKKGLAFAAIGAFPLFGLFIAIYGGLKANEELPVGKTVFQWTNAGIAFAVGMTSFIAMSLLASFAKQ